MRIKSYGELVNSPLINIERGLFQEAQQRLFTILERYENCRNMDNGLHFYILRDQLRLASDEWEAPSDFEGEVWVQRHVDPRFALHVSKKDPKLVAYTPFRDEKKRYNDVPIVTKLGKFLNKYYKDCINPDDINNIANAYTGRDTTGEKYRYEYIEDPEAIAEFYMSCEGGGMKSCMTKPWREWGLYSISNETDKQTKKIHPAEAYGLADNTMLLAIYERNKTSAIARTIVNKDKTIYVRLYGNVAVAAKLLAKKGYFKGDFDFTIPFINVRREGQDLNRQTVLLPYLDTNAKANITDQGFFIKRGKASGINGYHGRCSIQISRCSDCKKVYEADNGNGNTLPMAQQRAFRQSPDLQRIASLIDNNVCNVCLSDKTKYVKCQYGDRDRTRNGQLNQQTVFCKIEDTTLFEHGVDGWEAETVRIYSKHVKNLIVKEHKTGERKYAKHMRKVRVTPKTKGWVPKDRTAYNPFEEEWMSLDYVEKCGDEYWIYKNQVHYITDRVKAIISRDKKTQHRPRNQTIKHANKEEYYDIGFLQKFMQWEQNYPDNERVNGYAGEYYAINIRTKTRENPGNYWEQDQQVLRTGEKYSRYWQHETVKAA